MVQPESMNTDAASKLSEEEVILEGQIDLGCIIQKANGSWDKLLTLVGQLTNNEKKQYISNPVSLQLLINFTYMIEKLNLEHRGLKFHFLHSTPFQCSLLLKIFWMKQSPFLQSFKSVTWMYIKP